MNLTECLMMVGDQFGSQLVLAENDAQRKIFYANKEFYTATGFSKEQVLGRNCKFLQGEKTNPKIVDKMREAFNQNLASCQDIINYKANGEMFLNRLVMLPIQDTERKIIIGFQNDITHNSLVNPGQTLTSSAENGEIRHILNNQLATLLMKISINHSRGLSVDQTTESLRKTFSSISNFVLHLQDMKNFKDFSYFAS